MKHSIRSFFTSGFSLLIVSVLTFSLFSSENMNQGAYATVFPQGASIFADYESWPSSSTLSSSDTMLQTLFLMKEPNTNRFTALDINGDGLVDILYHAQGADQKVTGGYYYYTDFFAVMLNKGGNSFENEYICAFRHDQSYTLPVTYFGDCAE